jgi:Na+/proline symporter
LSQTLLAMSPAVLFSFIIAYFLVLLLVAWFTSRNANNDSFFIGNKKSNWMLVAFGMIGTSLSGVTFVSVPGGVGSGHFFYFQIVLGYLLGYVVIAYVLMPMYYRMNLTSIYVYLNNRFGTEAHKTGAGFFILSRAIGATARLYLVINVLQVFILDQLGIPFIATTAVILLMILLYTLEGGVKTIIYTDTLQTTGMLLGLVICIYVIMQALDLNLVSALQQMGQAGHTQLFNSDVMSGSFFMKQLLGGMFIAITMTGLDQEMMQKNISVKNLKDAQKNMMSFALVLLLVNFLFLFLGGILYLYAAANHLPMDKPDDLFPSIALGSEFGGTLGVLFIIALISALFPSVDGAITSLTSSTCIDLLDIKNRYDGEAAQKKIRLRVHITFAFVFLLLVLMFKYINDKQIIDFILKFAGITYGPLLGLFAFGILTRRKLNGKIILPVCLIMPMIALLLDVFSSPDWYEKKLHVQLNLQHWSASMFHGYKIGNELILINGLITFFGLWLISKKEK